MKIKIFIQNFEKEIGCIRYTQRVSCVTAYMFTENNRFDIFGIEWDSDMIIRVSLSIFQSQTQNADHMAMWLPQQHIMLAERLL